MRTLRRILLHVLCFMGRAISYLYSPACSRRIGELASRLFTAWIARDFKSIGEGVLIRRPLHLVGGRHVSIGDRTYVGTRAVITAWDRFGIDTFHPEIIIGRNVSIGDDSHITAINRIVIGDNVLTGKKITITDNAHGESHGDLLSLPPAARPLHSAGPVITEDGVWLGDKVTILPNVRIGQNAIIGANAVVTKDIPANCVAGGIPAKVLKKMD